jgi:hypothetical protein
VARQIARLGGFCEDSEGLPSRIVFYDAPVTRSEASSPRVGDDFRQRVTRALKGVGITTTEHLRVGAVKMGR